MARKDSLMRKGPVRLDENGIEHIVDFLIEEWWADDLYSFFTGTASASNIRAIEDTNVIQISKNNLELLYKKIPKFEFISNAKPSLFAYPATTKPPTTSVVEKVLI